MKFFKFVVLVCDVDEVFCECDLSEDQINSMGNIDHTQMITIKCLFPKFEDNVVTVTDRNGHERELVRSYDGTLYCFDDYIDRETAIKIFE